MTEGTNGRVVKSMSLTRAEFDRSMAVLDSDYVPSKGDVARDETCIHHADGRAWVRFEALPDVLLGARLALPRARVSITFENLTPAERTGFLARFDLAFQRGGG
ncbi:MAG: hypothetical protein NW216_13000 [Hyphomicrobium sp.]|nr:hypothetical protein [Hyphomicrobium sp.]